VRLAALALVVAACAVIAAIALGSGGGSTTAGQAKSAGAVRVGSTPAASSTRTASARSTGPRAAAVPILMYHVIAAPPAGAPFPGLYVPPEEFEQQMLALKSAGWHAVTLDQLQANWSTGASLGPGKPIVLSFDNGYQSQYTHALPVLRRLGWVGVENIQLTGLPPSQGGLGQEEIRGLVAAGWELDTQGFSHADLITLDAEQLHYQVAVARQVVQRRYHVPVNWFCYPSGHYDPTVVAEVRAAGYEGSTTVVPGWVRAAEDPYRMHRLRVLGGTSGPQLLELIADTRTNESAPVSYSGT
jgi:peptidoglycan/xylan/chitin deacetylase (PgdA/CDA1 family)